MRFSDIFRIDRGDAERWFDPVLSIDTRLFIDPFLLYDKEEGHFKGGHAQIIEFFNFVFKLIAKANGAVGSIHYRQALDALLFPEVEELCLGYTTAGTKGAGSGRKSATLIASAIWSAIKSSLNEITHFEEIALLQEGIGADRISDATAGLIRQRLATFTEDVCTEHHLEVASLRFRRGQFSVADGRWKRLDAQLPINPYNGKPILLVPRSYLRALPTINSDDFWDYCYVNENETLRREFSQDVTRHVSKSDIVRLARRHIPFLRKYVASAERSPGKPYDFRHDPKGFVRWYDSSQEYCREHQLQLLIRRERDFLNAISLMVNAFKHFVEENSGWKLLWNDNRTNKKEAAAQLLFLGIIKHYCASNNIDISKEPNIGRGPVDFKVSHGHQCRALLELKLANNTRFWNGLKRQLPTYQRAEEIKQGYYVVVVFKDSELDRIRDIQSVLTGVDRDSTFKISAIVVDARPEKPSASKL